MRLERLTLTNYRCFENATVEFEPSTVLVGANDAGKSTIVDAIECLFRWRRRAVELDNWRALVTTPPDGDWTSVDETQHVRVVATFSDLSPSEYAIWSPVVEDGKITFGRVFTPEDEAEERAPFLLLGPEALSRLAAHTFGEVSTPPNEDDEEDEEGYYFSSLENWEAELATYVEYRADGYSWLGFGAALDLPWPTPAPRGRNFPWETAVVSIRGPEHGSPSTRALLRPIAAGAIRAHLEPAASRGDSQRDLMDNPLLRAGKDQVDRLSDRLGDVVPRYVPGATGASVRQREDLTRPDRVIDAALGEFDISLYRGPRDDHGDLADEVPLEILGAGAQRATAMAALELYRDPDLWSPAESVLLLVEEPEVGLHSSAQRRVAKSLRELPTFGVQTVVVTHSPIFVNAADPSGLRVVRGGGRQVAAGEGDVVYERHHDVHPAPALADVMTELGCEPADVLLARRFLVVEGQSDAAVLATWARTIGARLEASGVQLVPSRGHTTVSTVAQFLSLAYEGARFDVVLDNGSETARTRLEIEAQFGERVRVTLLSRTEIEGYFTPDAVGEWLIRSGASESDVDAQDLANALSGTRRKKPLRELCLRLLHRDYDVVADGVAIAGLMREAEVPAEISRLLYEITNI